MLTCSWGSFILGVKEHINKISRETWDNLLKRLFTCFFSGKLRLFWVKWGEKLGKQGEKKGNVSKTFGIWKIQLKMGGKTGAKQQKFAENEGKKVKKR